MAALIALGSAATHAVGTPAGTLITITATLSYSIGGVVLSRLAWVHRDRRFLEMVGAIEAQADEHGRFSPGSMYLAWKGWSFADKKRPSPWLTFLVLRIRERLGNMDRAEGR